MTATVTRKPLPPVTGRCGWVRRWNGFHGLLYIEPTGGNRLEYEVELVQLDGDRSATFELRYADFSTGPMTFTCYRVTLEFGGESGVCSCPDATNRPERKAACKHTRALRAALFRRPVGE